MTTTDGNPTLPYSYPQFDGSNKVSASSMINPKGSPTLSAGYPVYQLRQVFIAPTTLPYPLFSAHFACSDITPVL